MDEKDVVAEADAIIQRYRAQVERQRRSITRIVDRLQTVTQLVHDRLNVNDGESSAEERTFLLHLQFILNGGDDRVVPEVEETSDNG